MHLINDIASKKIAVLYQALPPPVIGGVRKDAKPGGYSDSGADIACALSEHGYCVLKPVAKPARIEAMDWVFPDTENGIERAVAAGADIIWANTVLFSGHPLERWKHDKWIVGQLPERQEKCDDKFATNKLLRDHGLAVAPSLLVGGSHQEAIEAVEGTAMTFPLVVKPVRGRGSQGVSRVDDRGALDGTVSALISGGAFGNAVIVEQYLDGQEITITVMPGPQVLPPVARYNHKDGIAPYNGAVAVVSNSKVMASDEYMCAAIASIMADCRRAYEMLGALAPIRLDCRADTHGRYYIFDVNFKPNMTGAGRPGREDQDSLSAIAARAVGWDYTELLSRMLQAAWKL